QYLDNTTNAARAIKEYNYLNLLIRYTAKVKPFKEVVATLALNNITGALYANNGYTFSYVYGGSLTTQNYYFPQAGFNVLGGLTFKW
ncbi:MAG: TonB-dependent receptor, partial [Taibaiella sp.]|nr:TonB-dependent receptor [Taibaiella sp.]